MNAGSSGRVSVVALIAAVAVVGLSVAGTASTASAGVAEHLKMSWLDGNSTLTLPASDAFDDTAELDVTSNLDANAAISAKRLSGSGGSSILTTQSVPLTPESGHYFTSVDLADTGLTTGSWRISVKVNGVTEKATIRVGSGIATSVNITSTPSTVFVDDGADDELTAHVVAKDELGTSLPITAGTLTFSDSHKANSTTESLLSGTPSTAGASVGLSVGGFNPGAAHLSVTGVVGPMTSTKTPSATEHPVLSTAKLTGASITAAYSTVYLALGGYHAEQAITATVRTNTPNSLGLVSGSVAITKGATMIASESFSTSGVQSPLDWNALLAAAGRYTATVTAQLAGEPVVTKATSFTVSPTLGVKRTLTKTIKGNAIALSGESLPGLCRHSGSDLACSSKSGTSPSMFVLRQVPSSVLLLQSVHGFSVKVAVDIASYHASDGTLQWLWGDQSVPLGTGSNESIHSDRWYSDGPSPANSDSTAIGLEFNLKDGVSFKVPEYKITYYYWAP